MGDNIVLSILIPTYNRLSFLKTTVDCFVKQIKDARLENVVEIIIGNDYQKDDTDKYINQITSENKFISGWNHQKNLGLSQNVEFLIEKAKGKYILISGDDDLMRDGAVVYFIEQIQTISPNFILINTSNIISSDDANLNYKVILENRLNIDKDIFVENWEANKKLLETARDWLYLTNLLPAVIFRKDLYKKEFASAREYVKIDNVYLWQAQVLIGISKYGRLLVIANRFVLHRKNETNWSHDPRGTVYLDIFDATEISRLIKRYLPSEYKKYKKLFIAFVMGGLMIETNKGVPVRRFAWQALIRNLNCFPENIQLLSMVIAPKFITDTSHSLRRFKENCRLIFT